MGLLTFDDRDPLVSYSVNGNWKQGGATEEFNATTTFTIYGGATATLTFTGTSVGVYGTIANTGLGAAPQSSYSVDGGPTSTYTGKMLSTIQYRQEFYLNKNLSANEPHTLVVTTVGSGAFFYLDYFLVTPVDGSSTSMSSTSSSSSTTSHTPSSTRSAAKADSTIDTGVRVGIVVLIVGILVVIFVVIMVLRRRRKNALKEKKLDETEIPNLRTLPRSSAPSQITPFPIDRDLAPPPIGNTPNLMPSMLSRNETPQPSSGKGAVMYGRYAPVSLPDADPLASSATSSSSMGWGEKRQQQQQQQLLEEQQQQQRLLVPGTGASGLGSGSSSSSDASYSGYAPAGSAVSSATATATASSTGLVQSASQPEESMYDNSFEPPPPQYGSYV
ncbi:hypothetical protein GALMADRAFT_141319 [Galerina marginata CBS 339.88]|uniref:Uncharacterized protein n=1 Tax=Galerina marginata (strain CBS 339.88) TaxID=685588 RepID=A0A067STH1_GALM3|nr:hypothetical protein GALMADRAFT_141319 [Galerina marginata CBS 339.88]